MHDISPEEYASIIATDRQAFTEEVFNQIGSGDYIHNWHVDAINEYLQAVEEGDIRNLIINMPPRSLKSISISIAWSAWLQGHDPSTQIICASHSLKVGKELSGKCLDVMQSPIYKLAFPNTHLTKQTEEWFKTTQQGHRLVATVGNKVTGFGADIIIIDDPIDPESAVSETERARANRWIPGTLFGRANDQNTIKKVLVMQRLHEDDPSGIFKEAGWDSLILPAEFKKKTFIEINKKSWEFDDGDLMFPARLGHDVLDELSHPLKGMGAYAFSGQYMQNPAPIGGGEFKQRWVQHYNNLSKDFSAKDMNVYIMCDPASGKKRKSIKSNKEADHDYTAIVVVGLHSDKNYYVLDLVRDKLNPTQRIDAVIKMHMKWNKKSGKSPKVVYEDYSMQSDAFYIEKAMSELNYRFAFVTVAGRVMKEDRIRRLIPLFENERVYLPRKIMYDTVGGETCELVTELIDNEMMTFPVSKHDDLLDAFARLLETEVYASFPATNLKILKAGETYRDELLGNFEETNYMSW